MKLFVPGRLCLFGEHSDWAGGHRRTNSQLEKGYTIIAGTNQGIWAEVRAHPTKLIVRSVLCDGRTVGPYEVEMNRELLLKEAERGGFFSYCAGVAFHLVTNYHVKGLVIDNYRTDLPHKKGLSSSAAICVLTARAFNRAYDLRMTVRGEMEYAYFGEVTTPSRCGRMDQACAFGQRPVMMTFDRDILTIRELRPTKQLHFIVVDLRAGKDTRRILSDLNRCYPFADTDIARQVQDYLGPINKRISHEAADAIERGDAQRIGQLMCEAQREFDKHLIPACPGELEAPVLHRVLAYEPIQDHIWGGKGVGSQGDGSAQLIAKSAEDRQASMEILERDLDVKCLGLDIIPPQRPRKAVIPAAGIGTRLYPASTVMKKELFPVIDRDGLTKPAILTIVEEAVGSGIEQVGIIIAPSDHVLFSGLFTQRYAIDRLNKLPPQYREYANHLRELSSRVTLLTQSSQEGFGHAVYCAHDWVSQEPFLLMLGDHLYESESPVRCAQQVLDAYATHRTNMVGLRRTHESRIGSFGTVSGTWLEPGLLSISEVAEKPNLDYARAHLRVEGLGPDEYLCMFGLYVLSPHVLHLLGQLINQNYREAGEFQLTTALEHLRRDEGLMGLEVRGRRLDIGRPDAYREAVKQFGEGRERYCSQPQPQDRGKQGY